MDNDKFNEHLKWYSDNRSTYKDLCLKVEFIIREILKNSDLNIHSINARAKDIQSFKAKITKPKYTDPQSQITDLCGVRIICYVESDLKKIENLIKDNFEIDLVNSLDKGVLLGEDKVGYKSIHIICKIDNKRIALP